MLREGRTLSEVLEVSRRVFGPADTILVKSNNFVQVLCVLRSVPGPWLSEPRALEIRRVANEVVRGARGERGVKA